MTEMMAGAIGLIETASGLATDEGDENPEYDRALIELVAHQLGVCDNEAAMIQLRRLISKDH